MIELFRDHPATIGETYSQHLRFATGTGAMMIVGGCACVIHGLFPFLFTSTGSRTIRALAQRIDRRQPRTSAPAETAWTGASQRR
jgi:hypothetical protein